MLAAVLAVVLQNPNTCLAFVSTNLAKGNGNWYAYERFSDQRLEIHAGDTLVYSVFLDLKDPEAKGGIDIDFADGNDSLRDLGLSDQNGVRVHGDGTLSQAKGKWYVRKIALDSCKDRVTSSWNLVFEGDKDGRYAQFVDDVYVEHRDGTRTTIYENGPPPAKALVINSGYTQRPSLAAVARAEVKEGADLTSLLMQVDAEAERLRVIDEARQDVQLAKQFASRHPNQELMEHIGEAEALLNKADRKESTAEEIEAALHAAKHALSHTHPVMEQYTGHLVGHAHIDLQWLWEWQEGIVFSRDTFAQALRFMDEYPGFTFSQSSSAIYQAIEDDYPDIFKQIQAKVKKGQWEIVGGRICEGDTNMISPESHARHFLYGQRYFREKFGKTAVVGWEPDTFGHTIQMPQILKLGGCDYYYFCRGGKQKPLFWWKGLDGTKVLAFDEPASGSWYNSDLSYKQFQEMLDFEKSGNSRDSLMVYGVGNHGGGPTREDIETALSWMKDPTKPKVKFSTATQFFHKLETYNLKEIPVVDQELNPVFDGCYTTHSEVKQLNRDAENWTSTAEAVAAIASLSGFKYPGADLRRNWEDICFNHHHDTLPGSGIHAPYERTKTVLGRVVADDKDIATRAMESLVVRVTPKKGGMSMMVFNPTGWERNDWVECYLVKSGWDPATTLNPARTVAVTPDGKRLPVEVVDTVSRRVRFWAAGVPAYGYRVFQLVDGEPDKPQIESRDDGYTVETARWIVEFDRQDGAIGRVFDKASGTEFVAPGGTLGRLEMHWEKPGGMSAWVLGQIASVDTLTPSKTFFQKYRDCVDVTFEYDVVPHNSEQYATILQRFRIPTRGEITCDVDCDWHLIGTPANGSPLLRVAFDTPFKSPTATYEVPFGALSRPTDGKEYPALKWADMSQDGVGLAILNDSKYGFSASGNTLRMSLIRSSYEPDPNPNPGRHHWRYAILPHVGSWQGAHVDKAAFAFNQPLLAATVPYDARGAAPLEFAPFSLPETVLSTCLKKAEDDRDLVLRMYESSGTTLYSGAIACRMPIERAGSVNFLEDDLGAIKLGSDGKIPLALHPWEIRTVKIKIGAH